jgi:hypothetical protein
MSNSNPFNEKTVEKNQIDEKWEIIECVLKESIKGLNVGLFKEPGHIRVFGDISLHIANSIMHIGSDSWYEKEFVSVYELSKISHHVYMVLYDPTKEVTGFRGAIIKTLKLDLGDPELIDKIREHIEKYI